MDNFPRDHERWDIQHEVFKEYTRHHLEEEEKDVFPEVSKVPGEKKRNETGEAFEAAKEKQLFVL